MNGTPSSPVRVSGECRSQTHKLAAQPGHPTLRQEAITAAADGRRCRGLVQDSAAALLTTRAGPSQQQSAPQIAP